MHQNKYKISIVTVVKNDPDGLECTVNSALQQTYTNIELIVIDGCSDSPTLNIIDKYRSNISKYISEKDTGIYNAMNKGIKLATGDYILFLNAGDTLVSDTILEEIFDTVRSTHITPKIIYGGVNVYTKDSSFITTLKPLNLTKRNLNMFATRVVCHQSIFVKRDSTPLYNEKYALKSELDWYYILLTQIRQNQILKYNKPVSNYHLGGKSMIQHKKNFHETILVLRAHNSFLSFLFLSPFLLIPIIFRFKGNITALIRN